MKRTDRFDNELGLQLRSETPKRRVKAKLRRPSRSFDMQRGLGHGLRP